MSGESTNAPVRHRFFVYAPDKTDQGTLEKRLSVRKDHLAAADANFANGILLLTSGLKRAEGVGGALLTPESILSPDAPKKMLGSAFILEAESIDQIWELLKNDVYYKSGVWDPDKLIVLPYLIATHFRT